MDKIMLKKALQYSIIILAIGLVSFNVAYGQRIKGAVIAGGNLSQVEGDEIKGWSQFGFNGGLGAIIPFGSHWAANLETLFSQKGSFQKKQFDDVKTNEYRLRLNYFEVPVYASYTDKNVMTFGLGGYWARLVSAREQEHSGNQAPYIDSVAFNKSDFGFLVDVKVRIWKHLHLNLRYSQSLTPIRERNFAPQGSSDFIRKQYNQVIALRFVYIFNETKQGVIPE
jgi:opacity protein-like surface antigen